MIVTFFRSSSFNSWDFCPFQTYLSYTLSFRPNDENGWVIPKPQFKADKGSMVHKALELLARKKVAIQEGKASFSESEIDKVWVTDDFTPDDAFREAWIHYSKICPHWDWTAKDQRETRGWFNNTLTLNDGLWNPLNRKVVAPEQYFDFVIEQPWARYSYVMPDGKTLQGYLGLKGTVDLIAEVDENTIEYQDYKTGARKDWATGKEKDWKKLRDDPQLRIYHYAISRLYPQYKYIIMSILFVRDGGPYSLDFSPDDLPKTEKMLQDRFETIKNCQRPPRIIHQREHRWKCGKLCTFGMSKWEGTNETVCDHMHKEVVTLGMDRATAKHAAPNAFSSYGEGGGRVKR